MRQRGRIVAVDLYAAKLRVLHANCQRLGIDIVETLTADARTPALLPPASADAVLLDAPCSGWGVLNRRPDLRHHQSPQRRAELYPLQRELLRAAAELVRPGGVLLYVTCTLNPEENERQIAAFLRDDPRYLSADATARVPFFPWREAERQSLETGNLTLLPGIYGTDGMYYALLRRQA
jgi:16S rRNA (cytosine967-C5)-methyltransferase